MPQFQALIEGYRRFRTGPYQEQRLRYDRLAQGQAPKIMVIACSDSRVDPTRVFDTEPGQMFVLRNIANLVPPMAAIQGQSSVAAGLEFAVTVLEVDYVVVFGHARCGGITAALSPLKDNRFISSWVEQIAPARDAVLAAKALSPDVDAQKTLERAGVRMSLDNLRTYPFVTEAEAAGKVRLVGAIFDIADGSLLILDQQSGTFERVAVDLDAG
jgi:carbonic anhydrase